MDLQSLFYAVGIIFMIVMLLIALGIFIAVLMIRSKINHMHYVFNKKVAAAENVINKGVSLLRIVRRLFIRAN